MSAPPAEPLHFGGSARTLAGWLHRPLAAGASMGVLVCNPFGYEAVCAHRSLRHIAVSIAAAALPAMRFDYDGTGDSAGDDSDPGRLRAWIDSTHAAIEVLKARSGVTRVALLGLRLGALIATLVARERSDVEALVAFVPVVSGKVYLRELRILQGALGLGPAPAGVTIDPGVQEAVGFAITAETQRDLQQVDLTGLENPPARTVLVLDRDDLPGTDKWQQTLRTQGVEVDSRRVAGYVDMMLDPHNGVVPTAAVEACTEFLKSVSIAAPAMAAKPAPVVEEGGTTGEQFVRAGQLTGVAHFPDQPSGRAFLMLNAGGVLRIGPNRLYVDLARLWAGQGHLCLRVDITGIGDTPPRAGAAENVVYGPRAVDDVGEAVDWLRRQPGIRDVCVLGLCSGAYHALKAAVAGQPVDGVVVINPLTFFWKEGQSLDYPAFRVAENAARYGQSIRDPDKWKKLLRGQVDLHAVRHTVARELASIVVNRVRDLSRRVGLPWKDDLGHELEAVAARGVVMRFVFARGDPGLDLLQRQGGSAVPRLERRGALTIDVIDGPDHTFTPIWSQAALVEVLGRVLRI